MDLDELYLLNFNLEIDTINARIEALLQSEDLLDQFYGLYWTTHYEISKQEEELKAILGCENEQSFNPKQETISNILNYSKALSIRKSDQVDYIELVLN